MKKLVASISTAAALATASVAAPSIAANNTGDFLIAPAYFATSGYNSHIKVVNTNLTHSILARVVVRDSKCSQEVDFPIVLSPGDVWYADIYVGADGHTYIKSDDDSNYLPQLKNGLDLTKTNSNAGNAFRFGYVEIYPLAQFDEHMQGKVSKEVLKARYARVSKGDTTTDNAEPVGNYLTGLVTLNNASNNLSMTLPMKAIADAQDNVANAEAFMISRDTEWANYFYSNVTDIENLFEAKNVVLPIISGGNNTMALFTFINDHKCDCKNSLDAQLRGYRAVILDNEENRPLAPSPEPTYVIPYELGTVIPQSILEKYQMSAEQISAYSNGWVLMKDFTNVCSGQLDRGRTIPVTIATEMTATDTGSGNFATNWIYIPTDVDANEND